MESKRGPRGGYYLKREASAINLSDVVNALQGPVEELFNRGDGENASPSPRRASRFCFGEPQLSKRLPLLCLPKSGTINASATMGGFDGPASGCYKSLGPR